MPVIEKLARSSKFVSNLYDLDIAGIPAVFVVLIDRYSQRSDLDKKLARLCRQCVDAGTQEIDERQPTHVPSRFRLTPELRARIADDYRNGTPTTDIAVRYRIGKGTVLEILRNANVTMRRQGMTRSQIEQASELYVQGHSLAGIANKLGCPQTSIRWSLINAGVQMRGRHG